MNTTPAEDTETEAKRPAIEQVDEKKSSRLLDARKRFRGNRPRPTEAPSSS